MRAATAGHTFRDSIGVGFVHANELAEDVPRQIAPLGFGEWGLNDPFAKRAALPLIDSSSLLFPPAGALRDESLVAVSAKDRPWNSGHQPVRVALVFFEHLSNFARSFRNDASLISR